MRSNDIVIEIQVPVAVEQASRPEFEKAAADFLFGFDRVRPELAQALNAKGLDVRQLQRLSVPERVGACVTPDAHEFIPDDTLADYCASRRISLTEGGKVGFLFRYDDGVEGSTDTLNMRVSLGEEELPPELLGSVVHALFGDCGLAANAQKFLRANGVDIVQFARSNEALLPSRDTPMTTRVGPDTEALLNRLGFSTDKFGKLRVVSSKSVDIDAAMDQGIGWSKTTCC